VLRNVLKLSEPAELPVNTNKIIVVDEITTGDGNINVGYTVDPDISVLGVDIISVALLDKSNGETAPCP